MRLKTHFLAIWLLLCSCSSSHAQEAVTDPCTLQSTESHILLSLEESRGQQRDQETNPVELPISGSPGTEISLELHSEEGSPNYEDLFELQGKKVTLKKALDRDEKDLSSVMFQVTCTTLSTGRRKTIPVVLTISDINDNRPSFQGEPYVVTIPENTPVGTIIFRGLAATDPDSNVNGQVEFRILKKASPSPKPAEDELSFDYDNFVSEENIEVDIKKRSSNFNESLDLPDEDYFEIDLPHQGLVRLAKELDYEKKKLHQVQIVASDRAVPASRRLTSTTTLLIHVLDSDDQAPRFTDSLYTAEVMAGVSSGALEVSPETIRAEDGDSLRAEIRYSFVDGGGGGDASSYFRIEGRTGIVRQVASVEDDSVGQFDVTVRAEEQTHERRAATARLVIRVLSEDTSPPELTATATEGFVSENAAVGTRVQDARGKDILFKVRDADSKNGTANAYAYEMTSSFFQVDEEGYLVVNEPNLDRDPPNEPKLSFQVQPNPGQASRNGRIFVRETSGSEKSSSPLGLTVFLRDVNDNPPVISSVRDVTLPEGNTKRVIARINATDSDSDQDLRFQITHVSNNGGRRFKIGGRNGVLEVIGAVKSGERFAITIEAMDSGGLASKTIIEVLVTPAPNLRGPTFDQFLYEAPISEGAAKFTAVVTTRARDPEGGPVRYSLTGGNEAGHFQIEESTGVIRVMKALDRENISTYSLTVQAEDTGLKSSTASVSIVVTDVNDSEPRFLAEPYSFRVREGVLGAPVGRVKAEDLDSGRNRELTYDIASTDGDESSDSPLFAIDAIAGEIRTKARLDFEQQPVHYVVVTAKDNGREKQRSATATVTVLVQDTSDEVPYFERDTYESTVPENMPDYLVTTVQAFDKDTTASITYRLMSGDSDLFVLNPNTGVLRTRRGLDREARAEYVLTIGTEEARMSHGNNKAGGLTECTVRVTVEDRNDLAPVFVRTPRGNVIDIRNDVAVGERIGSVRAMDSDATEPGNVVHYDFNLDGSSERAEKYFRIDQETGDIYVQDDLTKEVYDEYRLHTRAFDLGEPTLSNSVTLVIRVRQVVTQAPDTGVGFAQPEVEVSSPEGVPAATVLTTLPLEQKEVMANSRRLRVECQVFRVTDKEGNSVRGLFSGQLNGDNDCDLLVTQSGLDREANDEYEILMRLNTLSAFLNPRKISAKITLRLTDVNDNAPEFTLEHSDRIIPIQGGYILAISETHPIGNEILKVKTTDADSPGPFSDVHYSLSGTDLFIVDTESGSLKVQGALKEAVDLSPIEMVLEAMDNPQGSQMERNTKRTTLMVNVLKSGSGIVLTVANTPPNQLMEKKDDIQRVIQDQTGLLTSITKILPASSLFLNGTCCRTNPSSSDVYFQVFDPATNTVLDFEDDKVKSVITSKRASSALKYTLSGQLGIQASGVHKTYFDPLAQEGNAQASESEPHRVTEASSPFAGWPALLLFFGCLVFAMALAAMVYLCVIKRRLQVSEEKTTKTIVIPRYEPVFVEPTHMKEYETQVLQMSVPIDDQDMGTLEGQRPNGVADRPSSSYQADTSHGHTSMSGEISLDSISYITKDRLSFESASSPSSAGAGAASASHSSLQRKAQQQKSQQQQQQSIGSLPNYGHHHQKGSQQQRERSYSQGAHYYPQAAAQEHQHDDDPITPVRNPLFKRSDSEDGLKRLSASQTNANVLFGENPRAGAGFVASTPRRKKSSSASRDRSRSKEPRSPIDSTTQL